MMNTSAWIASRLRIGAGGSRSARTGAVIAVAGVAIAIAVMEFTLAVVGGFRDEIREKVLGFDAEISITPAYNPDSGAVDEYMFQDSVLEALARGVCPDARLSLSLRRPAVVKTDSDFAAVYFAAYDPAAHDYAFERSCVTDGVWPDYGSDSTASHVVLSAATARMLNLGVGDRPMLYFVNDGGDIRARRARVVALFESRIEERDKNTAYASMEMLRAVSGLGEGWGTQLEIRGVGVDSAAVAAGRLQDAIVAEWQYGGIDKLYPVDNVARSGAVYLNWLDLLDTNVVVIFILMLLVAASTLVAGLFIIVLEHISTIGVLRSLGASKAMVRRVFVAVSMRLVGYGMIAGNAVGLGLLVVQKYTRIMPLDPEMYYIDHVPVAMNPWMLLLLNIGVALAAWLILVLPSRIAAKVDPAQTMRYE